ncbi:hypothetical protein RB195_004020 [Necator americanus]|uniref:Reverse transcriptase domain-containing protein n=1 Tax=Necator americanus TaxID=51031 RepID=A0ABR1BFW1_NECAM
MDLEHVDDTVIFPEGTTKLQHVVNLVSKLAAAYGLHLCPDNCKQMWISSRPRTGTRVDRQPIELVEEFCYLICILKNNGNYEKDIKQRCAKAISAFNSLVKHLWLIPTTNEVYLSAVYQPASLPIRNSPYHDETWAALSQPAFENLAAFGHKQSVSEGGETILQYERRTCNRDEDIFCQRSTLYNPNPPILVLH